jgi:predicted CXXCH cytochrome family protein
MKKMRNDSREAAPGLVRRHRRRAVATIATLVLILPLGLVASPGPDWPAPNHPSGRPSGWGGNDCGSCHVPEGLFSHPVDITPTMTVPEHLPLTDGRLTCGTCHRTEVAADHALARQYNSPLLRGAETGAAFCQECHDPHITSRAAMHAIALGRAHLRSPTTIISFDPHVPGGSAEIPALSSAACLSCHDGSVAIAIQHAIPEQDWIGVVRKVGLLPSHPVAVAYPDREGYVPADSLDSRLRLHDGRVECASCHSLYSSQPNLLIMSNDHSTLCLSCHDK